MMAINLLISYKQNIKIIIIWKMQLKCHHALPQHWKNID